MPNQLIKIQRHKKFPEECVNIYRLKYLVNIYRLKLYLAYKTHYCPLEGKDKGKVLKRPNIQLL